MPSEGIDAKKVQELRLQIFGEWYIAAMEALFDTLGVEEAKRKFKPYGALSGQAMVINLETKGRFQPIQNDILRMGVHVSFFVTVHGGCLANGQISPDSFTADVLECTVYKKPQREFCELYCNPGSHYQAMIETINPEFEFSCDMGLLKGLPRCRLHVYREGHIREPDRDAITLSLLPVRVTKDELDFWPVHSMSLNWGYFTMILIDGVGLNKAQEILTPYMERAGSSLALRLKEELKIEGKDARVIGAIIDVCHKANGQQGKIQDYMPEMVSGIVERCPLSTGGEMMCYQFEKFANGVCKAINPHYSFSYEKMMTRGAKYCKWVVQ